MAESNSLKHLLIYLPCEIPSPGGWGEEEDVPHRPRHTEMPPEEAEGLGMLGLGETQL